jgi:hypothetical protein
VEPGCDNFGHQESSTIRYGLAEARLKGPSHGTCWRPLSALSSSTPTAVWRDGATGALSESAVDMTLRLDNASALPPYPPPQQQQVA